jgi:hypothetical protein
MRGLELLAIGEQTIAIEAALTSRLSLDSEAASYGVPETSSAIRSRRVRPGILPSGA